MRTLSPGVLLLVTLASACGGKLVPEVVPEEPEPHVRDPEPFPEAGSLRLTSPDRGSWFDPGLVTVTGVYDDLDGITVNGKGASLADGTFEVMLTLQEGMNLIEARGTDAQGTEWIDRMSVVAGDAAPQAEPIEGAMVVRLNTPGLDVLGGTIADSFDTGDLTSGLTEQNPLLDEGEGNNRIRADVIGVTTGEPRAILTPDRGSLDVALVIPAVQLQLHAVGSVLGQAFDTMVYLTIEYAVVETTATLSAFDGLPQADLSAFEVNFVGFVLTADILNDQPDLRLTISEILRGIAAEELAKIAEEAVAPELAAMMQGLDLSTTTPVGGANLAVDIGLASVDVDPHGVVAVMDVSVDTDAESELPELPGYYTTWLGLPPEDLEAPLSVAVHDNLFQAVLAEMWAAGALSAEVDSEDNPFIRTFLATLTMGDATIVLDPQLPPIVEPTGTDMTVDLGEFDLVIETPGGWYGEEVRMRMDGSVPMSPYVAVPTPDSMPALGFELGRPELLVTVEDPGKWQDTNTPIKDLMASGIPEDALTSFLPDLTMPLPELGGVAFADADVARVEDRRWLLVTLDLAGAQR